MEIIKNYHTPTFVSKSDYVQLGMYEKACIDCQPRVGLDCGGITLYVVLEAENEDKCMIKACEMTGVNTVKTSR